MMAESASRTIGYLRVSKETQDLDKNRADILALREDLGRVEFVIERDLISARTKEALIANGSTQRFIAMRYNTTPGNFSNWMKKNEIKKPNA